MVALLKSGQYFGNPMEEASSYIRKWIKKGLSKDGKVLDFSGRRFTQQEALDLAEYVEVAGIEILYLHENWIKDSYLETLGDSNFFPETLRELWLYKNRIGNAGAQTLAQCERLSNLRYLSLYSNKVGGEGAKALANSPVMSHLETLDFSFNRLGDEGAVAIARSPYLKELKVLHLDANGIGFKGMKALAESTSLKSLTTLNIRHNLMDFDGLEIMKDSPLLRRLETVKTDLVDD